MGSKSADLSSEARSREEGSAKEEPFLQPWQFFLLGGMLAATATVIVATGESPANIIILSLTVVSVSFVGLGAYRILLPLVMPEVMARPTIAGRTRVAMERERRRSCCDQSRELGSITRWGKWRRCTSMRCIRACVTARSA